MATPSIIGVRTPSIIGVRRADHWHGTFIGYDGGLDHLGTRILDLVMALGGDLDAVWSRIASAPDGWRHAFSEPYEPGFNTDYFKTGRTGPPLLTDEDRFVRMHAAYWYIFDLEAWALDVYAAAEEVLLQRVVFSRDGHPQSRLRATNGPEGPDSPSRTSAVDWAAAMERAYHDYRPELIEATARRIEDVLATELPIAGLRTMLASDAIIWIDDVKTVAWPTTLVAEGFACPLKLFIRGAPDPSVPTLIIEDPGFILFRRRAMSDPARCEAALRSALGRIAIEIGLAKVPVSEDFTAFAAMFPFHVLDARQDAATQDAAIKAEVKKAFTTVK